jgi:hypothetical protein
MSDRLMVKGLCHEWKWSSDNSKFFEEIDKHGGWPVGYQYIGFEHSDERAAGFTNSPHGSGWWTIIAGADDYYLWKLSPAALQRIVASAIGAVRFQPINAEALWIKDSRGGKAATAKAASEGVKP